MKQITMFTISKDVKTKVFCEPHLEIEASLDKENESILVNVSSDEVSLNVAKDSVLSLLQHFAWHREREHAIQARYAVSTETKKQMAMERWKRLLKRYDFKEPKQNPD